RVQAHAGRERDRIIGVERHHRRRYRRRDAGGDEYRALVHAGIAEDLRVDEHDVDHRQKRGQAGDEFGTQIAARFAQAEHALEKARRAAVVGCGGLAHGVPPWPRPAARFYGMRLGQLTQSIRESRRSQWSAKFSKGFFCQGRAKRAAFGGRRSLTKKSFRKMDCHCDRRRTTTSSDPASAASDQRAGAVAADESTGRITPQPTRSSGSRPCTRRSKVCGTSGMRSGKRALMSAGGVGVVSAVSQTTTAPLARMSAGVTEGERAGSSSK